MADADVPPGRPPSGPTRIRKRPVISCTECHRRKQKCDREQPCSQCKSRSKDDLCHYEKLPSKARAGPKQTSTSPADPDPDPRSPAKERDGERSLSLATTVADLGYSHGRASTLYLLKRIEATDPAGKMVPTDLDINLAHGGDEALKVRYKDLIRQLPARAFVEPLVGFYFRHFNWQYSALDRDVFDEQLRAWYEVPFDVLSMRGPSAVDPQLRVFPALLFEVLAIGLLELVGPTNQQSEAGEAERFEGLKYAGGMTFGDLAVDYGESGMAILTLLGKTHITLATVQAGFLRATLLKYMARVTEAWHAIGSTIRDAQEIGMHRDSLDPKPEDSDTESQLENMWLIERRRRLYMILSIWDLHCSSVLGRPGVIDHRVPHPTLPVDALFPRPGARSTTVVRVRDPESDPPTPLTRAIWSYKLIAPLRQVLELEGDGPYPRDWERVERVHRYCLELDRSIPAYFRADNPDRTWDELPECREWLVETRHYLPALPPFSIMALHRPYAFGRAESRAAALWASMEMLRRQRPAFNDLDLGTWKNYSLFFGSFDAVIFMASMYILFPGENENAVLATEAHSHFVWTTERFAAMRDRNPLARMARIVLRAISDRFCGVIKIVEAKATASPEFSSSSSAATGTPWYAETPAANQQSLSLFSASEKSAAGQGPPATRDQTPTQQRRRRGGGEVGPTPVTSPGSGAPCPPDVMAAAAAAAAAATKESVPVTTDLFGGSSSLAVDMDSWARLILPYEGDVGNVTPIFPMGDLIFGDPNRGPDDVDWSNIPELDASWFEGTGGF